MMMNKQQATQFVTNLFKEVWTDLNPEKISVYYHANVLMHFGKQEVRYQDIVNRMAYIKKHNLTIRNQIEDVLVDGDKVCLRLSQQYIGHDKTDDYRIIAIYQLKDGKVAQGWAVIDDRIDYYAK
jgi:predicted SnoaL-like aldol condensation-catalyzing enzyme